MSTMSQNYLLYSIIFPVHAFKHIQSVFPLFLPIERKSGKAYRNIIALVRTTTVYCLRWDQEVRNLHWQFASNHDSSLDSRDK